MSYNCQPCYGCGSCGYSTGSKADYSANHVEYNTSKPIDYYL